MRKKTFLLIFIFLIVVNSISCFDNPNSWTDKTHIQYIDSSYTELELILKIEDARISNTFLRRVRYVHLVDFKDKIKDTELLESYFSSEGIIEIRIKYNPNHNKFNGLLCGITANGKDAEIFVPIDSR